MSRLRRWWRPEQVVYVPILAPSDGWLDSVVVTAADSGWLAVSYYIKVKA